MIVSWQGTSADPSMVRLLPGASSRHRPALLYVSSPPGPLARRPPAAASSSRDPRSRRDRRMSSSPASGSSVVLCSTGAWPTLAVRCEHVPGGEVPAGRLPPAGATGGARLTCMHRRSRLHGRHRGAAGRVRGRPARAPSVRGTVPERCAARGSDVGDELRLAGRGATPRVTPTSRSTGPHGRRPPTTAGTSVRSSTRDLASRSRSSPDPAHLARARPRRRIGRPAGDQPRSGYRDPGGVPVRRWRRSTTTTWRSASARWVSYEGSYELDEETLADGSVLDDHFGSMGGWITSTLVRLGDLKLQWLPPEVESD